MDIGSLTGQIAIEDQMTDELTRIASHVKSFAEGIDGAFGAAAISIGVVAAAVTGAAISITALGTEGSTILGVEDAFNHLAEAAGQTGDSLREGLVAGVHGTVDEFELMKTTMRAMSAGVKLTGDDMTVLGETARAMAKATGGDASDSLQTLSNAMTTGRTRALAMAGVIVNVHEAEEKFAKSLGVTTTQLNEAGKLEAHRIGILEAARAKIDQLGVSELSFKERVQQAQVAVEEWGASLAKSVAASPHVLAAFDAIQAAILKAFGGTSQMALDAIVEWVNRFADAAAHYGPMIIQTIVDIWHGVRATWEEVTHAWDLVPEWFKNVARDAGLAAVAVGGVVIATGGLSGADVIGIVGNLSTTWATFGKNIIAAQTAVKEFGIASLIVFRTGGIAALIGELTTSAAGLSGVLMGLLATPIGVAGALATLGAAVYQTAKAFANLYQAWKDGKSMWDFFSAKEDDNFIRRWAGFSTSIDKVKDSTDISLPKITDYQKNLEQTGVVLGDVTNGELRLIPAREKQKFTTDKLTDAEKKYKAAIEEYTNSTAKDWMTVMDNMGRTMYEGIAFDLKRGRSVEELSLVYGTTKGVIESVQMAEKKYVDAGKVTLDLWKSEKENLFGLKENILNVDNAELHWLETQNKQNATMKAITELERQAGSGMQSLATGLENVGQKSTEIDILNVGIKKIEEQAKRDDDAISSMADGFVRLGSVTGGMFGEILGGLGQMIVLLDTANKMTKVIGINGREIGGSFGALSILMSNNATNGMKMAAAAQAAASVAQGVMDVKAATEAHRSALGNAAGGAVAGAKAGAAFGPWGIAIGAAAGFVVGIIRGKPEWAKAAEDVGRDFGIKISDELGKSIAANAKTMFHGDRAVAEVNSLAKIIGESADGINNKNFDQLAGKLRDVFVYVGKGQMSAAQAAKVLDDNFAAFVAAGTDGAGRLNEKLKEMIQLNQQYGTDSKAIADYLKQQGVNSVAGFNAVVAGTESATKGYADIKAAVDAAKKSAADLIKDHVFNTDQLNDSIKRVRDGAKGFKDLEAMYAAGKNGIAGITGALNLLNQGAAVDTLENAMRAQQEAAAGAKQELSDLGLQAVGTFAAMVASGSTVTEALSAIGPGLQTLKKSYEDLGLEVDDVALSSLMMQSTIFEGNPALMNAISGLSAEMVALDNMGLMNIDTFGAMERTGLQMYTRLQASVAAAGGTTKDALIPMQGYLHDAVKQAELLGIPIDENTQSMIDQSVQLGIWKDVGKSATDKLTDGMLTLVDAVQRLVDTMSNIPRDIHTTVTTTYVTEGQAAAGHAGGGTVYAAMGANILPFTPRGTDVVPAMLTPGERVLTVSQNEQYTKHQNDNVAVLSELRAIREDNARRDATAERRLARIFRDEAQKIAR